MIKKIVVAIVALVVGFTVGMNLPDKSVGSLSEMLTKTVSLQVGEKGTALRLVKSGACTLVSNSSIAATSTGTGTCAITGVLAGDVVMVSLATTTTKMSAQIAVVGTVASTDSVTVRLLNLTGTASTPGALSGFGSSTQYTVYR